MPVPLNKHAKIWVNPEGVIPEKIRKRLRLQRRLCPEDSLTLFVNKACLTESKETLQQLIEDGVKIKVVEDALAESLDNQTDDPQWINIVQTFLERAKDPDNPDPVKSSVMVSDYLRITNCLQNEGVYSDTDVMFLDGEMPNSLDSPYLIGAHQGGQCDLHIFGMEPAERKVFQEVILEQFKFFIGDKESDIKVQTFSPIMSLVVAGMHDAELSEEPDIFVNFLKLTEMRHIDFPDKIPALNVVSGKDDSHHGNEAKLHAKDEDTFLTQVKEQYQKLHPKPSPTVEETNDEFCQRMKI